MNIEQGINIVSKLISNDVSDANAQRAQEIKAFVEMVALGKGEKEAVKALRPSEETIQKEQRARIYHSLCGFAANTIIKYVNRLKHVEDVRTSVNSESGDVFDALVMNNLKDFYDDKSLFEYLVDVYVSHQKGDPNALIYMKAEDVKDQNELVANTVLRPKIIPSNEIYNIKENDNGVEHVTLRYVRSIQTTKIESYGKAKSEIETVYDYYFYAAGLSQVFVRTTDGLDNSIDIDPMPELPLTTLISRIELPTMEGETRQVFDVYSYITTSIDCPMVRVSGRRDAENVEVCTSILMSAKDAFNELISRKSELDVTIQAHVFPKMAMVTSACSYQEPSGERCDSGYCGTKKCPSCQGTGKNYHVGGQDIITITIDPRNTATLPDITKMLHYFTHDEFAPKFLEGQVSNVLTRISNTVFETNVFEVVTNSITNANRSSIQSPVTATQSLIDWFKMYMALNEDAQHISKMWERTARLQASALSFTAAQDIKAVCKFPKDFKFSTLQELLVSYKAAQEAGLPFDVTKKILMQIIEKQSPDDATATRWAMIKMELKPFSGLDKEQLKIVLLSRGNNDFQKVLYENFDEIFDIIEHTKPEFIGYDYARKMDELRATVTAYISTIDYAAANDLTSIFNSIPQ